jgi:hypothetical protein
VMQMRQTDRSEKSWEQESMEPGHQWLTLVILVQESTKLGLFCQRANSFSRVWDS